MFVLFKKKKTKTNLFFIYLKYFWFYLISYIKLVKLIKNHLKNVLYYNCIKNYFLKLIILIKISL